MEPSKPQMNASPPTVTMRPVAHGEPPTAATRAARDHAAEREASAGPARGAHGVRMSLPYHPGRPLSCRQVRALDVLANERLGLPGLILMENAGRGVAELVFAELATPATARVAILCGPGNNGGDGFVAARHLRNAGVHVDVLLAAPPERSVGDAGVNLRILQRAGFPLLRANEPAGAAAARTCLTAADVIVDALLGTGSRGGPRGTVAELIRAANAAPRARRVAIDLPSGLDADTGASAEPCFRAHLTATLVAAKVGFAAAAEWVGRVVVLDIGLPTDWLRAQGAVDS